MIYFISDAHLGSRLLGSIDAIHEQERKICLMLRSFAHDATEIFLLGDMIDFWFEYSTTVPKGYTRFLGCLSELADAGIKVHYFAGNHDMWTYGYLEQECGVIVHKKPITLNLCGKKCLLAHGDGLYETNLGVKIIQWIFHSKVCRRLYTLIPSHFGIKFGLWWSAHNRRCVNNVTPPYYGEDKEFLVLYAKDCENHQHRDFYIFGHRHILLDIMLKTKSRVIILGDCITEYSYAAMDEEGNLELKYFEE